MKTNDNEILELYETGLVRDLTLKQPEQNWQDASNALTLLSEYIQRMHHEELQEDLLQIDCLVKAQ